VFGAYYFGQPYFSQGPNLTLEVIIAPAEIVQIEVQIRRKVAMDSKIRRRVEIEVER
jgi:hypothetical protein